MVWIKPATVESAKWTTRPIRHPEGGTMLNPLRGPRRSPGQVYRSPMGVHECMRMAGRILPFLGLPNTSVASRTKVRGTKSTLGATNV